MLQGIDQCGNSPIHLVTEVLFMCLCVAGVGGGVRCKREIGVFVFIHPDLGKEKI